MRIVDIREQTLPISSPIRNAYIDFSKMTLSLVAVITDAGRSLFRKAATLHARQVKDLFMDRLDEQETETLLRVFSRLGCALEDGERAPEDPGTTG